MGKVRGERATYIKLTNIFKVLVQRLHHVVDELEQRQLVHVLIDIDADDEVQRGIPSVDHLVLSVFKEGALCRVEDFVNDRSW